MPCISFLDYDANIYFFQDYLIKKHYMHIYKTNNDGNFLLTRKACQLAQQYKLKLTIIQTHSNYETQARVRSNLAKQCCKKISICIHQTIVKWWEARSCEWEKRGARARLTLTISPVLITATSGYRITFPSSRLSTRACALHLVNHPRRRAIFCELQADNRAAGKTSGRLINFYGLNEGNKEGFVN